MSGFAPGLPVGSCSPTGAVRVPNSQKRVRLCGRLRRGDERTGAAQLLLQQPPLVHDLCVFIKLCLAPGLLKILDDFLHQIILGQVVTDDVMGPGAVFLQQF